MYLGKMAIQYDFIILFLVIALVAYGNAGAFDGMAITFVSRNSHVFITCNGEKLGLPELYYNESLLEPTSTGHNTIQILFTYNNFQPGEYKCRFPYGEAKFTYKSNANFFETHKDDFIALTVVIKGKDRAAFVEVESVEHETKLSCIQHKDEVEEQLNPKPFSNRKYFLSLDDNNKYNFSCMIGNNTDFKFTAGYVDSFPKIKDFSIKVFKENNRVKVSSTCKTYETFHGAFLRTNLIMRYNKDQTIRSRNGNNEVSDTSWSTLKDMTYICDIQNRLGYDAGAIELDTPAQWNLQNDEYVMIHQNLNEKIIDIIHHKAPESNGSSLTCTHNDHAMSFDSELRLKTDLVFENNFSCHSSRDQNINFAIITNGYRPKVTRFDIAYEPNGNVVFTCAGSSRMFEHEVIVTFTTNNGQEMYNSKGPNGYETSYLPNQPLTDTYFHSNQEKAEGVWKCIVNARTGKDEIKFELKDEKNRKPKGTYIVNDDVKPKGDIRSHITPGGNAISKNLKAEKGCFQHNRLPKYTCKGNPANQNGKGCYDCYEKSLSQYTFSFQRVLI